MNKYLEKIAREYVVEEHVETPDWGPRMGTAASGVFAAHLANKHIGTRVGNRIGMKLLTVKGGEADSVIDGALRHVLPMTNTTENIHEINNAAARETVKALPIGGPAYVDRSGINRAGRAMHLLQKAQALASKIPLVNTFVHHPGKYVYKGAKADKNYVYTGRGIFNSDATFHELGHAIDLNRGARKTKIISDALSRGPGRLLGAAAGGAMLSSEKTRDYAWAAPLVAAAPMLRSEAMANIHGHRLIKAHGGIGKTFKATAALNTASYLLGPGLAAGALYGLNKIKRHGEKIDPDEWLSDR